MTRLMQAAQNLEQEKVVPKTVAASAELGITKTVAARWIASEVFFHMKVAVDKLPLLKGEIIASEDGPRHMVIVDVNKNKVNRSASYTPKVTVLCGADLVRNAKKNHVSMIDCWIGAKAAKVLKLKVSAANMVPCMGFNPSPNGPALGSFNLPTTMSKTSLNYPDFVDYGPAGSELNNPQFMTMLNIQEALSMYLSNLKNGIWKPVSSQWAIIPPSLMHACKEAKLLAKEKNLENFAPLDFVFWQQTQLREETKHKYVGTDKLSASKFAFVGDMHDPSTWLFRADSINTIQESIGDLKACAYLSKKAKILTVQELKKRSGL